MWHICCVRRFLLSTNWYLLRPVWFSIKIFLPLRRVANKPVEFQRWNSNGWKIFWLESLIDFVRVYPAHCLFEHNCWYGTEQIRGPWCEVFKVSATLLMSWKAEPYLPLPIHRAFVFPSAHFTAWNRTRSVEDSSVNLHRHDRYVKKKKSHALSTFGTITHHAFMNPGFLKIKASYCSPVFLYLPNRQKYFN
jgi:hypothetical protein